MTIKVKVQKDYLRTEASIELPADVAQVDSLLKATKTNGKMVVLYNEGHIQGINVEQNTKITEGKTDEIREMLKIGTREL